jgi:hypothetical protein
MVIRDVENWAIIIILEIVSKGVFHGCNYFFTKKMASWYYHGW